MNTSEIGSEFHYITASEKKSNHPLIFEVIDDTYTFSGRTALEVILKNLTGISKALLPSYCCDSMLNPFRAANIEIEFYDVFWDSGLLEKLEISDDTDLILWCNYFGFNREMPNFGDFIKRGGVVIEDITHSFLSDIPFHSQSQYIVASVRKWFPLLCGGYCASMVEKLQYKPTEEVPDEYINTKTLAMKQKTEYLNCDNGVLKEQYLQNFSWSNHWLTENYSNRKIDLISSGYLSTVDIEDIRKRRIENAAVIYKYLDTQTGLQPMFDKSEMNCPLFVPVLCKNQTERDELRQKLIYEKIYCPVHWPRPDSGCDSNLYDLELSLICDQRYGEEDMKRMMKIVSK